MIAHVRGARKRKNDYMGMADGEVVITTKVDESGAEKGLKSISQKMKALGSNSTLKGIAGLGSAVTGAVSAFNLATKAIGKVSAAIKEMSALYETQKNAEIQLQRAIKNNPYADNSAYRSLSNFASELQSVTTYGDEELLPLMAQLNFSGRTQAETMDIMSAAVDVAASGVMSLDSAVKYLNSSYNGLAGELGERIPQVKSLTAEEMRQGKAVEIVAKMYAGTAKEAANATGGSKQLANALGDLKEEVGAFFTKPLIGIKKFFAEIVSGWASALKASREYKDSIDKATGGSTENDAQEVVVNEFSKRIEVSQKNIAALEKTLDRATRKQEEAFARVTGNGRKTLDELSDLDRQYYQQFADAAREIADKIELEREKIEGYNEAIAEAQNQITKNDEARAAAAETNRLNEEIAARDKLRAEYDAAVAAKEKEIALRRSAGEEISAEAEAQEMYNTAFAAYIKMMSDPAFSGNSGNYEHETGARAQIAEWAQTFGGEELKRQVQDFEAELRRVTDELNGTVKSHYDTVLDALDAEYEAVISNKYLEEEEKLRIEREYADKRAEISDAMDKAEKKSLTEKISAISGTNESYWSEYKRKTEELARLEKEIEESTVLSHEEKEAAKTEISEAAAQARKNLIASVFADVDKYTSQAVNIMNQAANLMLETVQNQATAEQAELELKWRKGEIGEEEYNEKITESKKKAAKEQYKIQMFQWSASILQATANVAQGITQAIAQGGIAGLITGAIVGAAGAVQIASIIASKPTPPSFAGGGIVPGNSYSGDRVRANVNSGEMILNAAQQRSLWEAANGRGAGGGTSIVIHNSASNVVRAQPQITKDKIDIMIDARVSEGLRSGRYGSALNQAQQGMGGDFYGI